MKLISPQLNRLPRTKPLFVTPFMVVALSLTSASTSADVMLGAYLPNDGFSRQVITDFNDVIPKKLAYVNVFSAFSHDWDNLYWQSSNVVAENAIPMVSWMPIDLARPDDNLLPEIAIGLWDDYLIQWGTKLSAWVNSYPDNEKPRVAIRFAHEFNGNWYPYSNTPESYKAAWQHIHDTFESIGVNQHVDWIWSASKVNVDDYNDFTVYYPGDAYVDWTSLDGYNWGSNYSSGGWSSFKTIFSNAYLTMVDNYPEKPIMIAETASAEPSDLPNLAYGMYGDNSDAYESKSVWIADMLSDIESDFPAVRALSLFNNNKELNWSISTEVNTGMDSWVAGTQSAHYTSEYLLLADNSTDDPVLEEPSEDTKGNGKGRNKEKGKPTLRTADKSSLATTEIQENTLDTITRTVSNTALISTASQVVLAQSKKPKKIDPKFDRALATKLRNLSKTERKQYIDMKMAVINY